MSSWFFSRYTLKRCDESNITCLQKQHATGAPAEMTTKWMSVSLPGKSRNRFTSGAWMVEMAVVSDGDRTGCGRRSARL